MALSAISERLLVARPGPRVRKRLSCFRNKLPVIPVRMQSQLQHSERVAIPHFTVRFHLTHRAMRVLSARTHHKFPNAVGRIRVSFGVLWCETFVIMIVAVDNYISARVKEHIPERFHLGIITVLTPGAEEGLVEVGERASRRMLCQVLLQPLPLRRSRLTTTHFRALAVQHHDMPRA